MGAMTNDAQPAEVMAEMARAAPTFAGMSDEKTEHVSVRWVCGETSPDPREWRHARRQTTAKRRRIEPDRAKKAACVRRGGNWLAWITPVVSLAFAGCAVPSDESIGQAQRDYLAAKAACVTTYPRSLTAQADCRTHAANEFIRPYYRYGDLMTESQEARRSLAVAADRREITRKEYDRQVARAEQRVAREEQQRNDQAHLESSYTATPLTSVVATISRIFN
jgi:hypothetical protein